MKICKIIYFARFSIFLSIILHETAKQQIEFTRMLQNSCNAYHKTKLLSNEQNRNKRF